MGNYLITANHGALVSKETERRFIVSGESSKNAYDK